MPRPYRLLCVFFGFLAPMAVMVSATAEDGLDIEYAESQPLVPESLLLDIVRVGDRLVAAGERGHIVWSDNGQDWVQAEVVPTRSTINRLFVLGDRIWAVGHDSVILTSGDHGKTWTRQYFAPDRMQPIMDVYFSDENHGLVIGAYGLIMVTADGGNSWDDRLVNEEDDYHLNALLPLDESRFLIAGEAGYSYRSSDGGETWASMDMPYFGSMFGAVRAEGDCVLYYGLRGHVLKSCDFGESWVELDTGMETTMSDAVSYDGKILMVGNSGVIMEYDGDGGFSEFKHSSGGDFAGVIQVGEGRFLLVGEDGVHHFPETPAEEGAE